MVYGGGSISNLDLMKLTLASAAMNNDGITVVANVYAYGVSEQVGGDQMDFPILIRMNLINSDFYTRINSGNVHYDPKTNIIKIPVNVPENKSYRIYNIIAKGADIISNPVMVSYENGIITIKLESINSKTISIDMYGKVI